MNNSLGRFCASRARLVHRSKNLVLTRVPQKYNPAQLFNEAGMFAPRWLIVDPGKVHGKNNGVTFIAGINHLKRTGRLHPRDVSDLKAEAWKVGANG